MELVSRHLHRPIADALGAFRVVVLHGARQVGKSTLARLVALELGGSYTTLEDPAIRQLAQTDPGSFLEYQSHPLVIDEIQLGGDSLVRAVKQIVDEDPKPGKFLLTGSTNFLTVPRLSESLAGRARILRLSPLSQAELAGRPAATPPPWLQPSAIAPQSTHLQRHEYMELVCRGGYPEPVRFAPRMRTGWFESYAETVIQRDIIALSSLRRHDVLPRLLRLLSARTGTELNLSSLASTFEVSSHTIQSYMEWMETVFLVLRLPVWSRNLSSRTIRRPKNHICDTGLAAGLLGLSVKSLTAPTSVAAGSLIETFTVNEIHRQITSAGGHQRLYHYRDRQGYEVDLVIEEPGGAVIAIEIKATSTPTLKQLRSLRWFRDRLDTVAPGTFKQGLLLHTGQQNLPAGDRLRLQPIDSLWTAN